MEVQDETLANPSHEFNRLKANYHGVYYLPTITTTRLRLDDKKVQMADIQLLLPIHNPLLRKMY